MTSISGTQRRYGAGYRRAASCGEIIEAAHLVNPSHRLAVGREQQDGTVVDDDLHVALVVLDDKLIVLDGVARLRIAASAAEVEEVLVEAREHVLGEDRLPR